MIVLAVAIVTFVAVTLITLRALSEPDQRVLMVLDYLTTKYLSERPFTSSQLSKELNMDKKEVEKVLEKLERAGIVVRMKDKWALKDPLVFLTQRDYQKASMLTAGDNIIYGAYQIPYLSTPIYILVQLFIVLAAVVFATLTYLNVFGLRETVSSWLKGASIELFLLFIIALAILMADVVNNFFKMLTREKYSVVVGFHSGILYDRSATDELSGRITRGSIVKVDVDVNLWQKLNNYFGEVPVGDVVIWVRNRSTPIRLRSMPYPLQLYYVIRAAQLGALEWRKRHARTIALWRYGYWPWGRGFRRRR